ncbi:MarR family winged helix-turn-helix transcriptional regulator [Mesorhizobium sp. 2RAF21]|uniref:MarR family winged helix-turn-helix transcriptional regulator n=1 Tax=Mesorhizobium sp. 2RAF21 TaxID=3232995 RepID=UPI003F9A0F38
MSDSLCFLVQRANRIISRQLDDALRPVGLTRRQMIILDVIGENDTLSQSALADIIGKDHTTLTANLGPLTSRGLVESRIDGGDRRVRNISLTADGAVLRKHARHVLKTFDAALCGCLEGDADLAALQGALQRLGHFDPVGPNADRDGPARTVRNKRLATDGRRTVEMLKRWLARLKFWAEALEGIDDPRGDYLLRLEKRVCHLEDEVQALRNNSASSGAADTDAAEPNPATKPDEPLRF